MWRNWMWFLLKLDFSQSNIIGSEALKELKKSSTNEDNETSEELYQKMEWMSLFLKIYKTFYLHTIY